jgi:hypothetical protein
VSTIVALAPAGAGGPLTVHGQAAGTIEVVTDVGVTPFGAFENRIVIEFVAGETRCGFRPADWPLDPNTIVKCGVTSFERMGTEDGVAVGPGVVGPAVVGALGAGEPPPPPPHAANANTATIENRAGNRILTPADCANNRRCYARSWTKRSPRGGWYPARPGRTGEGYEATALLLTDAS